jgi:fatty-acyl-CoA synthase
MPRTGRCFTDLTFMPLVEKIAPKVESLKKVIVMTDAAHMPETALPNVVSYEEWLKARPTAISNGPMSARMHACGHVLHLRHDRRSQGRLYSHRSNVLHAMMAAMPDAMGIGSRDVILPVVPMFHANAWGLGQTCPMIGAKMVMPGGKMDGESIYELLDTEKVTFTAAVPTVWLMLLQYLEAERQEASASEQGRHRRLGLPARHHRGFERDYGVEVIHAWGMTEMSPLGSLCTMKPEYADSDRRRALLDIKQKQGHHLSASR